MKAEGYEIQPGVMEYKPNLTIVSKTVIFLKYNELVDFYNFKFADDEKILELVGICSAPWPQTPKALMKLH